MNYDKEAHMKVRGNEEDGDGSGMPDDPGEGDPQKVEV